MDWVQRARNASLSHTHNTPEECLPNRNADDTVPNYCCSADGFLIEPLQRGI